MPDAQYIYNELSRSLRDFTGIERTTRYFQINGVDYSTDITLELIVKNPVRCMSVSLCDEQHRPVKRLAVRNLDKNTRLRDLANDAAQAIVSLDREEAFIQSLGLVVRRHYLSYTLKAGDVEIKLDRLVTGVSLYQQCIRVFSRAVLKGVLTARTAYCNSETSLLAALASFIAKYPHETGVDSFDRALNLTPQLRDALITAETVSLSEFI